MEQQSQLLHVISGERRGVPLGQDLLGATGRREAEFAGPVPVVGQSGAGQLESTVGGGEGAAVQVGHLAGHRGL
ncbi:hypothetical protein [Streptomyces sp. NPDC006785]|uniref:hypothetical protein n=1 Tax=unclassified Streptomyces TaxID=2593676 RepID=UPI0033FAA924